jgi:replication factor A1
MTDLHTHAEDIVAQFSDHLDLSVDDVEERLDNLVNEYRVPVAAATPPSASPKSSRTNSGWT